MTYTITRECIACDRCVTICPTNAIQKMNHFHYQIDRDRCTNCVPSHSVPQCWAVCPTNAACTRMPQSSATDYWDKWFTTYEQAVTHLHQTHPTDYWGQWFGRYAKRVSRLLNVAIATS